MERSEFLKRGFGSLLGIVAIAACKNTSVANPSTTGTTTGAGSTNGNSASNCSVTPSETEGPFPTKIPTNFVRQDIRADRTGVATTMAITIKNGSASCAALAGAIVDVWHCDKDGAYSEYGSSQSVDFLRGRQTTDANGVVNFTTVFPGWYSGRAPHVHVHIFSATGKSLLVTQIAFPFNTSNTVYTTAQAQGYTRGAQDTTNERDGIFSDGYTTELATVTGSVSGGYALAHTIVVNA
jgi:protocatechuate 3,4-dioxygenase beta subunit